MAKKAKAVFEVKVWRMKDGARTGLALLLPFVKADIAGDVAMALREKGYGVECDRWGALLYTDKDEAIASACRFLG